MEGNFVIQFAITQYKSNYTTEEYRSDQKKETVYKEVRMPSAPNTIEELVSYTDWEECTLSFNGVTLDNKKTLKEYGIENNSVIDVVKSKSKYYYAQFLTGKIIKITKNELKDSDLVLKVKEIILEKENIPVDQQRVICYGTQLMDNRTLYDYNIQIGCTFHVVLRLRSNPNPAV